MDNSAFSDIEFYKKNAELPTKPSGFIVIGGEEVANTLQCAHCGMHWIVVKGSGRIRGYCQYCHKATCGEEKCHVCIPYEATLEFEEGKKNHFTRDILENISKFNPQWHI